MGPRGPFLRNSSPRARASSIQLPRAQTLACPLTRVNRLNCLGFNVRNVPLLCVSRAACRQKGHRQGEQPQRRPHHRSGIVDRLIKPAGLNRLFDLPPASSCWIHHRTNVWEPQGQVQIQTVYYLIQRKFHQPKYYRLLYGSRFTLITLLGVTLLGISRLALGWRLAFGSLLTALTSLVCVTHTSPKSRSNRGCPIALRKNELARSPDDDGSLLPASDEAG